MEIIEGQLSVNNKKIGIVTSRFNSCITEKLEFGALERLEELGLAPENILRLRVPGAVELPLTAKWLLENGCEGVICLGAVIRGETDHYDYVCSSVENGCTMLMQSTGAPIAFGVLTTENKEQALERSGGKKGNKGRESVDVIIEMLNLKYQLTQKEDFNV